MCALEKWREHGKGQWVGAAERQYICTPQLPQHTSIKSTIPESAIQKFVGSGASHAARKHDHATQGGCSSGGDEWLYVYVEAEFDDERGEES